MIDHIKQWLEIHPLSPLHVDCATTVMLKILDGKCKMNTDEKVVMALLYEAACFPTLAESFCPRDTSVSFAGLVDSFPIVMAQRSRRYHAKVAPEYVSCGYCSSKQRHYYGVKLHLIGDRRAGTMPSLVMQD